MNILILEPFFSGSHRKWMEGYQKFSQHQIDFITLPGRHWKWRMHGGAVSLAKAFLNHPVNPDLLIASSMLDLSTFLSLTRKRTAQIPTVIYFHENQLTYPWSATDNDPVTGKDRHYGFINYTSALSADRIFFNSVYHQNSFLEALPGFLKAFPDHRGLDNVEVLKQKSRVLPLGMDLMSLDPYMETPKIGPPVFLWNHRWEYDKNPETFFRALFELEEKGVDFRLVVLGEGYAKFPPIFALAYRKLEKNILHWGFAKDHHTYAQLLWQSDIALVTSTQDFFGGSVVESIYTNNYPILPNRLAYPEHIPADQHSRHLYNNQAEMSALIQHAVDGVQTGKNEMSFSSFTGKYDWSVMAKSYDATFEQLGVF